MNEALKGSNIDYIVSRLDEKYKDLLQIVGERYEIEPLQSLNGGFSGAYLFLAKVKPKEDSESRIVVLKLDRYDKLKNENEQHERILNTFSDGFRQNHLVKMAFPAVILSKKRRIALFYEVAGQSFTDFRPLRDYTNRNLTKSVIDEIVEDLLNEWKQKAKYNPEYGINITQTLFNGRYNVKNNNIESFLSEQLGINPTDQGLLVGDSILPSAFGFLVQNHPDDTERKIYLPLCTQHGDLNQGNILVKNPRVPSQKHSIPYYLIDFLHCNPSGSCLFDILSLELSHIVDYVVRTQLPLDNLLTDIAKLGSLDLSAFDFSTEFGVVDTFISLRNILVSFVHNHAESYQDDWYASFNLVGIAVGLIATNTKGLPLPIRTLTYIYAASHLKFYMERFELPGPKNYSQIEIPSDNNMSHQFLKYTNNDFESFFRACNSFAPDHIYIGIFGPSEGIKTEALRIFSRIPWSAVIDFDPNTESPTCLLGSVKEYINQDRFVHLILPDNKLSSLNPERACYWFAARGLADQGDVSKLNLTWKYWYRNQSRALEGFLEKLAASTLKPITIIIFWNDKEDYVEDTIKMITRLFDERVNFILAHPEANKKESTVERFGILAFPLELPIIINGLRSKLPAVRETREDIVLPVFEGLEKSPGYLSLPIDVFNWLEEDCAVIHINLALTQKINDDDATSFLRGRRINWFELNLHIDIDRELTRELLPIVEESLSKRERTIIKLAHHPGAGGTTIACRIAWDLHWTYPVLVLRRFSTSTIDRIRDVYTRTQQPVLLVIDSSFVSVTISQTSNLYEKVLALRVPAVFLTVVRDFDLPKKTERVFPLHQQLNNLDAYRFESILSREVPEKKRILEKLVNQQDLNQRTPFVFGLTAYEKDFLGIEAFVRMRLQNISEQERTIIVLISLTNYFSNQGVTPQIFTFYIGLPPSQSTDLRKYLDKRRLDLLISDENGWRPLHALVAKEILVQLLADNKEPEQWREMLPDYAVKIIHILSEAGYQASDRLNEVISNLLRGLFIDRQDAESDDQAIGTFEAKFSNFIEAIPSNEGKRMVFNKLVEEFDDEPHFWGHRSRYIWHSAKDISDYEEAIASAEKALSLSREEDSALYHIKGMALAKWATFLMRFVKVELDSISAEMLKEKELEIEQLVIKALEVFKYIREELRVNEERAYVSAIELLTRFIEFGKEISPYETFAEFFRSPSGREYSEYLQEAENLLRQVRRIKVGYSGDSRFVREREIFLGKIYDNYSLLISGLWELLARDDVYRPKYRRSLAYAYLARSERDWDKLNEQDLNRILSLMEENLLADPQNNSHNIRLWFEAARRLRSTGLDSAIQKLTQWVNIASRVDVLDAYYYLYALQSIAAIEGSNMASIQAQRSLEMSKQLAQDRPNRASSLDWVGNLNGVRKLVSRGSLGRFQEETMFFGSEDITRLARLSGRIYRIQSGQSGIIRAYGLDFFFTPSPRTGPFQFIRERDDNLSVSFYGSFTYDGPRAWNVEPI